MDFISRDIRMTGFWGCAGFATIQNKLNTDASISSPDHPTFDTFASAVSGANDDSTDSEITDGTDSITLRGALGSGVNLTAAGADKSAAFSVTNNSGLADDDFVVISNCTSGDIFQITDVASGDTITHGSGNSGELGNVSTLLGSGTGVTPDADIYDGNAQIYKLNFVTYLIGTGAGGQPALFRHINGEEIQEIVAGVENMQIQYGEDTDADGTPDYYVSAGTAGLDMGQVVSIRIELLIASRDANVTSKNVDYSYNGASVTPTDRRLRRVYSSTIAVRNRLP
jgi:type IV pilus assembly protein PilW